ncbi:MAG: hypothetical protein JXQ82_04770 [Methanomicrobiaceae archaeon]|nr:hypothetical protein [Methanomicrobiaceae archaeon]
MARELSERDIEIFRKTAPEYSLDLCPGSGKSFQSVLPPLLNHISKNTDDFKERLSNMSENDWEYLISLILSGEESVSCLSRDALESVLYYVSKISPDDSKRIEIIYELSSCGLI